MRERRLGEYERRVLAAAMRGTCQGYIWAGAADDARAVARALVRLTR